MGEISKYNSLKIEKEKSKTRKVGSECGEIIVPTAYKQKSHQRSRNLFVSVLKRGLRKLEKLTVLVWVKK